VFSAATPIRWPLLSLLVGRCKVLGLRQEEKPAKARPTKFARMSELDRVLSGTMAVVGRGSEQKLCHTSDDVGWSEGRGYTSRVVGRRWYNDPTCGSTTIRRIYRG
jgi:hypothetical protein